MVATAMMGIVRDWIKDNCPCLDLYYKAFGVDSLDDKAESYSVESVPAAPIIKRYLGGATVRQCAFSFVSRSLYDEEVLQNAANLGFFEALASWFEECNAAGTLPELGENQRAKRIEVTTNGYVYDTQAHTAKYRMECRLIYDQSS